MKHCLLRPSYKYIRLNGSRYRIITHYVSNCARPFSVKNGLVFIKSYSKQINGKYVFIRGIRSDKWIDKSTSDNIMKILYCIYKKFDNEYKYLLPNKYNLPFESYGNKINRRLFTDESEAHKIAKNINGTVHTEKNGKTDKINPNKGMA